MISAKVVLPVPGGLASDRARPGGREVVRAQGCTRWGKGEEQGRGRCDAEAGKGVVVRRARRRVRLEAFV